MLYYLGYQRRNTPLTLALKQCAALSPRVIKLPFNVKKPITPSAAPRLIGRADRHEAGQ